MNTLNSNLKSLLDHAIMVDDCKYNVPYQNDTGYGVYQLSNMLWLSSLVDLHNKFYSCYASSYIACDFA